MVNVSNSMQINYYLYYFIFPLLILNAFFKHFIRTNFPAGSTRWWTPISLWVFSLLLFFSLASLLRWVFRVAFFTHHPCLRASKNVNWVRSCSHFCHWRNRLFSVNGRKFQNYYSILHIQPVTLLCYHVLGSKKLKGKTLRMVVYFLFKTNWYDVGCYP